MIALSDRVKLAERKTPEPGYRHHLKLFSDEPVPVVANSNPLTGNFFFCPMDFNPQTLIIHKGPAETVVAYTYFFKDQAIELSNVLVMPRPKS